MNKTSIVSAVVAGIMTLATCSAAFAADVNLSSGSGAKTNSSDVMVMPGTDSQPLRLHFSGAERLHHELGGLTVFQTNGERMHYRPDAYQVINGKHKPVEVNLHIEGNDQVTVEFGKVDKSAPVILKRGAAMFSQPVRM